MGVTLTNKPGAQVTIINTGAVIQKLLVPDRDGNIEDVVLGFDSIEPYQDGTSPYFGAIVGRVANRIANATFNLDGKQYQLAANNGPNCLHGGIYGFNRKEWTVVDQGRNDVGDEYVTLEYTSIDGEEGFPGTVTASITYSLSHTANTLHVTIKATTTAPTPLNLAQHSYFNLGGHASGTILDHELLLVADYYTPVNDVQIPTGEIIPVSTKGDAPHHQSDTSDVSAMDFTQFKRIGRDINKIPGPDVGGYDHHFVLFGNGVDVKEKVNKIGMAYESPQKAASLHHPTSGRALHVYTTAPGVQLYTGNFLDGTLQGCKEGARYPRNGGVCLETQGFPDAINQPVFPGVVLQPHEEYRHEIVYEFYTV